MRQEARHGVLPIITAAVMAIAGCTANHYVPHVNPLDHAPGEPSPYAARPVGIVIRDETPEELLARARREADTGDLIGAMITLKSATLPGRDPWNIEAHLLYQDIMLRRGKEREARAEYRRLLHDNLDHPIAFFLALRPLLLPRLKERLDGANAPTTAPEREPLSMEIEQLSDHVREVDGKAALKALEPYLTRRPPLPEAHALYQDVTLRKAQSDAERAETFAALTERYRALLREYEIDGGVAWLFERLVLRRSPEPAELRASALRYLQYLELGLDGERLYGGLGDVCDLWADTVEGRERDALRLLAAMLYLLGEGEAPPHVGRDGTALERARTCTRYGELAIALETWRRGTEHWPDKAVAWGGLSDVAAATGRAGLARDAARQALELLADDDERAGALRERVERFDRTREGAAPDR